MLCTACACPTASAGFAVVAAFGFTVTLLRAAARLGFALPLVSSVTIRASFPRDQQRSSRPLHSRPVCKRQTAEPKRVRFFKNHVIACGAPLHTYPPTPTIASENVPFARSA